MKNFLFLGLATLTFTFFGCGGGSDKSAQNPNDAAAQFSSPTGTLSSSNADAVGQASVDAKLAGGTNDPFGFIALKKNTLKKGFSKTNTLSEADITSCIETSDTKTTIDWKCVYDLDTADECTGSGTTTETIASSSDDFFTIAYNGFSVNCGAGTEFSCDGEVNISISNAGVFCSDITCTSAGEDHSFEGCSNAAGDLLITVDGKTFVVSSDISTDGTCTKVTMTITDSTGTAKTMTCDVASSEDGCTTLDGVETVASCTIN